MNLGGPDVWSNRRALPQDVQTGRPARPQRAKRRRVPFRYVESLSEARTPLADCFNILPGEAHATGATMPTAVLTPTRVSEGKPKQTVSSSPLAITKAPTSNSTPIGFPLFLQPKLAVSQPDDPYEQEADRVAEQVMRMPELTVQRKCAVRRKPVRRKPAAARASEGPN